MLTETGKGETESSVTRSGDFFGTDREGGKGETEREGRGRQRGRRERERREKRSREKGGERDEKMK